MHKNSCFSLIINSRIVIRISDERAWHPLQENEMIFSKKYFSKILDRIFEKIRICTKNACSFFIINSRIIIRISDERVWHPLQEKEAIFSKNYFPKILDQIFEKLRICIKMPASPSLLTVE